jgi:hypothetical protein
MPISTLRTGEKRALAFRLNITFFLYFLGIVKIAGKQRDAESGACQSKETHVQPENDPPSCQR